MAYHCPECEQKDKDKLYELVASGYCLCLVCGHQWPSLGGVING